MQNTLESQSGIVYLKSKFFLVRVLTYFSFLLIPILIPKTLELSSPGQAFAIGLYILFICGQWFFLGKEIDHRFKIYFRVNSSIDRLVYRLFLGMFFFIIYFNILSLVPSSKWTYNFFWITWISLGIFYSWPTRGKIIKESVTSNFSEFRYLDSFEKTLVGLTIIMFILSLPELPELTNPEALKLYFDPSERVNEILWRFVKVNYYPFLKYPQLVRLAWCLHYYFINLGLFLFCFYALLRFFVSRRLSLLGVFGLLSSWSWSQLLMGEFGISLSSTYSLLWIWTMLWVTRSSTYRTGLFLGLVGFYGTLINYQWWFLWFPQLLLMYFFLNKKTTWFKKQTLRYSLFGLLLTIVALVSHSNLDQSYINLDFNYVLNLFGIFKRKAFFILSPFGFLLSFWCCFKVSSNLNRQLKLDDTYLQQLGIGCLILSLYDFFSTSGIFSGFSFMWILTIFSLIPIELIFQKMSRLRSRRNIVYLFYILICLLDSHFEERVKIFLRSLGM